MAAGLSGPRQSFANTARQTYKTHGIRGFYFGLIPTLLRAFPTNACAYAAYEGILVLLSAEKVCAML
jgi:solute carrier family 25 carnitine/acylcarnitine transporter 20/29